MVSKIPGHGFDEPVAARAKMHDDEEENGHLLDAEDVGRDAQAVANEHDEAHDYFQAAHDPERLQSQGMWAQIPNYRQLFADAKIPSQVALTVGIDSLRLNCHTLSFSIRCKS